MPASTCSGGFPGMSAPVALAQIPGGTLDPAVVPKFATPMLIPPVMPRAATIRQPGGKPVDYYEISMRQIRAADPPRRPPRDDGLGVRRGRGGEQPRAAHPQRSLAHDRGEVEQAGACEVDQRPRRRERELPAASASRRPDPALGEPARRHQPDRDSRPTFAETPGAYTGPVPIVTHVHGAVGVADDSDGYAEAWYLPAASNIPAGYATEGTWYEFFAGKAAGAYGVELGTRLRHLPVPEREPGLDDLVPRPRARHDAAQRLRGPGRLLHRPRRAGRRRRRARLANRRSWRRFPARRRGRTTSSRPNKPYREIPIAIQDRSFNEDGSLFYPDSRAFFDGIVARLHPRRGRSRRSGIPSSSATRSWSTATPGRSSTVEQRRYRFRFLNGCQSRFLILDFSGIPGVEVWQIGNEGGFLAAPVEPHGRPRQPAAHGPGRAGRRDRRLHQRAGRELRARQRRPRRAVRRRRPR